MTNPPNSPGGAPATGAEEAPGSAPRAAAHQDQHPTFRLEALGVSGVDQMIEGPRKKRRPTQLIVLAAFQPQLMRFVGAFGLNVAVLYGFGLIIAALLLALVYAWVCRLAAKR